MKVLTARAVGLRRAQHRNDEDVNDTMTMMTVTIVMKIRKYRKPHAIGLRRAQPATVTEIMIMVIMMMNKIMLNNNYVAAEMVDDSEDVKVSTGWCFGCTLNQSKLMMMSTRFFRWCESMDRMRILGLIF